MTDNPDVATVEITETVLTSLKTKRAPIQDPTIIGDTHSSSKVIG